MDGAPAPDGPAPAVHHGVHGISSSYGSPSTLHSSIGGSLGGGSIGIGSGIGSVGISSGPIVGGSVGIVSSGHGVSHGGYDEKPDPFHFTYGVHDDQYYTDFSESRSGDAEGNIQGEYQVALPDGRIQYVTYTADNYGGTVMNVEYKGEARHPEIVHAPVVHDVTPVVHDIAPSYHGY